ncbi:Acetyltransferase (GNAT) family protein [Nonomuraea solani]|uniref:Acetyltransferase (GNAT) family protein n=1 Tax=Nonomuraea solani TaxID=1144553 RepID=A0A1H5U6L2_9ACTN|nr:GNAT family N-acetyltransferase [Nonomuraea solani]SEF70088.1 Acetyltransferase (GNAT) family protein [Nonomuraea solani]
MRIQPIELDDRPDEDLIRGLHDAFAASSAADDPGPLLSYARFRRDIFTHTPGERPEAWAVVEDGKVAGGYALSLSQLDNTHMGWLFPLAVRPERAGRGLGSALFEHALDRLRTHGRSLVLTETPATGSGARFAEAHGMTVALRQARRTLDLTQADWPALERLMPEAKGYSLELSIGPAAPELLPDLATLMNGMNDAPRDGGVENVTFTLDRVRDRDQRIPGLGETCYTAIARRDSDGAPAGYTRVYVRTDRSHTWAAQSDTTVLREHRGHRLGLLLKLGNLLALREHEPHIERVITWNATSNAHMLAINEAMGFELFDEWTEWRLEL